MLPGDPSIIERVIVEILGRRKYSFIGFDLAN